MNKAPIVLTVLLILGLITTGCAGLKSFAQAEGEPPALIGLDAEIDGEFARATGPVPMVFPRDHGPHPDYLTEWWYYTGNLETASGRHFGYQLTFFRRAILPDGQRVQRQSAWAAEQVYMAHFTLTDTDGRQFHPFERFGRGSAGLAGAQAEPHYRVWLEDWSVEEIGVGEYRLTAAMDGLSIDLRLSDRKGPVLQGEDGFSLKGSEPGNASYYISQTRLETVGTVSVEEMNFDVSGLSWMDHEYSTSALGPGLVGWDWFSIQLDDHSELMLFTLRRDDGTIDAYSSGTVISADGSTRPLAMEDFAIEVMSTWRSPHSGAVYPSGWRIEIPSENLVFNVSPRLPDQELNLSFVYWEGAVQVRGTRNDRPITGSGYIEMTGYAQSMQGQF